MSFHSWEATSIWHFPIIFNFFLSLSLFLDSDDRLQLLRNSHFKSVMSSVVMTVLRVSVPLLNINYSES